MTSQMHQDELTLEALDQASGGGFFPSFSVQQSLSSALAQYRWMQAWNAFGRGIANAGHK